MKQQSGFTLIELIMVIVILGILAATALPKFTDLAKDARIAKLNGARSAVLAASGILHGTVLARGKAEDTACPGETITGDTAIANNSRGATGTVCTENGVVSLKLGYPIASTVVAATNIAQTGIISAAGLTSVFRPTKADLNAEGYGVSINTTSKTVTFSVIGGSGTTTPTHSGTADEIAAAAAATTTQVNATCSFTYAEPAGQGAAPVITAATTTGC